MKHFLRILTMLLVLFAFSEKLLANSPPPLNDSAWSAENLGFLDQPAPCPAGGVGSLLTISGTTQFASYVSFNFSPAGCYPNGSPDVWYKFSSAATSVNIDVIGSNGLDTFFVKLWYSHGSAHTLIPLNCETSVLGIVSASFNTPQMGGEYYIEIGGHEWYKTGDFIMNIKAIRECDACVKESDITMSPSPWFGRYGTSELVTMCYTVERWDALGSDDIHGIVPRFGPDWDTTTLTAVQSPTTLSTNGVWRWASGVSTPDGTSIGYFFDKDNDLDVANNEGDSGAINAQWQACWKISTLPYCNTHDLSVTIKTYSDVETGTGVATNQSCIDSDPLLIETEGWCCPTPFIQVIQPTSCQGAGYVNVNFSNTPTDSFNITVYDEEFNTVAYYPSIGGLFSFVIASDYTYLIEFHNLVTGCDGYATIEVPGFLEIDLIQEDIACSSGYATAIANISTGIGPFIYNFTNHPANQQQDSLAYGVQDGWLYVTVVDFSGCPAYDSVWIGSLPALDLDFDYGVSTVCKTDNTISVLNQPATFGGLYYLVSPSSSGISVDQQTGLVDFTNSTITSSYWIIVKYFVTIPCNGFALDSFEVTQPPPSPTVVGSQFAQYCIGDTPPTFTILTGFNEIGGWYDNQTGQTTFGNNFTPPLNGSDTAGPYTYLAGSAYFSNIGCVSTGIPFIVNAVYPPYFTISSSSVICLADTAQLQITPCSSCVYLWTPAPTAGPSNSNITYTSPGNTTTYTAIAIDQGTSCTFSLNTTVFIDSISDCDGLTVYSGITPNGDGHNDTWEIDGIEDILFSNVTIYNRWGQLVWETGNYNNTTNFFNGKDMTGNGLPDGTYFYIITGLNVRRSGWIELTQ
jgi:gliding motility-associated-like protein